MTDLRTHGGSKAGSTIYDLVISVGSTFALFGSKVADSGTFVGSTLATFWFQFCKEMGKKMRKYSQGWKDGRADGSISQT